MARELTIQIRAAGDRTVVAISGTVDEDARFGALAPLTGKVEINLKGVRRFNSVGIREWIDALRALGQRAHVVYVECSPAVITQVNMISGFLGGGVVRSFYATMLCSGCDQYLDHLLDPADCEDGIAPVRCASCGAAMELDEVEDQYLLFLREPTRVG